MPEKLTTIDYSFLQQCMHCGMCLPTCPTYDLTKRERHGPRGRIALMRAVVDGELPVDEEFSKEMSYCLGCLACQTACPAGVDYARLFEAARAEVVVQQGQKNTASTFWRWLTLEVLFMNPRLLRGVARMLRIYQKSDIENIVRKMRLTKLLPASLRNVEPLAPRIGEYFSNEIIEAHEKPLGKTRYRVAVLTGCVQDLVFANINRDTVDVLLANGCAVDTPPLQGCCGSLHGHNGEPTLAAELARAMIDQFPPKKYDAIISNAGGCGSHLRHYSRLLADDPQYAEVSKIWDSKLRDIHEWLAEIGCRAPLPSNESSMVVTYHESCHLTHGQKVRLAPVSLLRLLPCVSLVELYESAWCCGSAGVYSITQPETSDVLLDRKVRHILATGASILATSNPGCHLQIERGLRAAGSEIEILQPVTLLARAYRREQTSSQTL